MTTKIILYAEDRDDDVFLFRRACRRAGLDHVLQVHAVPDGQAAVDYLSGEGAYADRARNPLPDLVLLDLKMPRRSGLDVLGWVREQSRHPETPVFLLTSSNQETDIHRAAALRADGYIIKPSSIAELAVAVLRLAAALGVLDTSGQKPSLASASSDL